ncbi:hypothetical protein [Melghirimyces profundicolus]|uniref:hypothetical protein n=1 Tax=Melghirimyces profundicolus TaxID=1242148 RepID=UPI000D355FA8|nr:hypothetical protein [Melghirimyces profundicolus]
MIWSRNWWCNPSREMERIDHEIRRLVQKEEQDSLQTEPQLLQTEMEQPARDNVIPIRAKM